MAPIKSLVVATTAVATLTMSVNVQGGCPLASGVEAGGVTWIKTQDSSRTWRVLDQTGQRFKLEADDVRDASQSRAWIDNKGQWTLHETFTGRQLGQAKFDYVTTFNEGVGTVERNGKWG